MGDNVRPLSPPPTSTPSGPYILGLPIFFFTKEDGIQPLGSEKLGGPIGRLTLSPDDDMNKQGITGDVNIQARHQKRLGGTRVAMFAYAMIRLENMAFIAMAVSLVTYFYGYMNFSLTKSATTLTNFSGTAYLLSLFGGFISDTYLSRFKTCILCASFEVVGYALLAIKHTSNSGIRAALPSLGADQYDQSDPKKAESLARFLTWVYVQGVTTGAIFGVTFVVWISANKGWDWGFSICTVAVLVSALFLLMGKSMYQNYVPKGSPISRILQVFVVAIGKSELLQYKR
ncbi:NRT1/ PTR family 4.5-like protein [Tanacetum coccineum]